MKTDRQFASILHCLNSAYNADPEAIHAVLCSMSPCKGKGLYKHPHVIVNDSRVKKGRYTLSPFGVINGILTAAGLPRVAMKWEVKKGRNGADNTTVFVGFVEYKDPSKKRGKKKV